MSFKTKKYQVIRGALSRELANFIFNYMMLQREAVDLMLKHNKVNLYSPFIGTRTDQQIPGAYSKYADWVMEALLMFMIPIMRQRTGLELIPTYSYTRLRFHAIVFINFFLHSEKFIGQRIVFLF